MAEFNEKNGYIIEGQYYQYNLEWLIRKILEFEESIQTIIDLQTIHYADPIQWDITTQYAPNTVVVDAKTGIAYMSKKAVPAGILLSNEDFWVVIFNYQKIYDKIMTGVAFNDMDNPTATKDLQVNDLVWFQGDLYRATRAITEGSKYIVGTNITPTSIESLLVNYYGRDRTAQVMNDTINVSGDYTLNAGDIAETSTNRTEKITKDREVDIDGTDSLHVDGVTTINRGGAITEVNGASVDRRTVGQTTEQYDGGVERTYNGKLIETVGQSDRYVREQETIHGKRFAVVTDDALQYGTPTASYSKYFNGVDMIAKDGSTGYRMLTENEVTKQMDGLLNLPFVKVTDYGTDKTAFQNAMRSNASVIIIPPGTYYIDNVRIPSNKHVVGYGAHLVATGNNIFANDADGVTGVYGANYNITIEGIDFSAPDVDYCTPVGFGHADNVKIINCTFHDLHGWHYIELNSCSNGLIQNCSFSKYGKTGVTYTEMIQLDYASAEGVFPWFGPYDSTPTINTKILNCSFESDPALISGNVPAGIGNHTTGVQKINQTLIANCFFQNLGSAFKFVSFHIMNICNCDVYNCNNGFYGGTNVSNLLIDGCQFIGRSNWTTDAARGIFTESDNKCEYINVKNNVVRAFGNHGISVQGRFFSITGNHVYGNGVAGIYAGWENFGGNISDNEVWGNHILDGTQLTDLYINLTHLNAPDIDAVGDIHVDGNKIGSVKCTGSADSQQAVVLMNNYIKNSLDKGTNTIYQFYNNWVTGTLTDRTDSTVGKATVASPSSAVTLNAKAWTTVCTVTAPSAGLYLIRGQFVASAQGTYQGSVRAIDIASYDATIASDTARNIYNEVLTVKTLTSGQKVNLEVWNNTVGAATTQSNIMLVKLA